MRYTEEDREWEGCTFVADDGSLGGFLNAQFGSTLSPGDCGTIDDDPNSPTYIFAIIGTPAVNDAFHVFEEKIETDKIMGKVGLDYNLSQINIQKNNSQISEHAFRRQLQDQLVAVERAYWQLVAARRVIVIEGRLIAELQRTYDYLYARREFDVTKRWGDAAAGALRSSSIFVSARSRSSHPLGSSG